MAARLAQLANTDSRFPILCIFLRCCPPAKAGKIKDVRKTKQEICFVSFGVVFLFFPRFFFFEKKASIYPYSQVRLNVGDEADGHEGAGTGKPIK